MPLLVDKDIFICCFINLIILNKSLVLLLTKLAWRCYVKSEKEAVNWKRFVTLNLIISSFVVILVFGLALYSKKELFFFMFVSTIMTSLALLFFVVSILDTILIKRINMYIMLTARKLRLCHNCYCISTVVCSVIGVLFFALSYKLIKKADGYI